MKVGDKIAEQGLEVTVTLIKRYINEVNMPVGSLYGFEIMDEWVSFIAKQISSYMGTPIGLADRANRAKE